MRLFKHVTCQRAQLTRGSFSALIPLLRDLPNHGIGSDRIQPKDLNSVSTSNLHLQSATDGRKFQMFLCRSDRSDEAQGDLANVRTVSGGFNSRNRTRDNGRVTTIELRTFEQTLDMAHVQILALSTAHGRRQSRFGASTVR